MVVPDTDGRIARSSRLLVVGFLLLALLGGTGVAAADGETRGGVHCPPENPERGSEHASEAAVERSVHGRTTALTASGCR